METLRRKQIRMALELGVNLPVGADGSRSSTASATQLARIPEPPKLIRGSVRPLVGSSPVLTPMLMKPCTPIHTPIPCATRAE